MATRYSFFHKIEIGNSCTFVSPTFVQILATIAAIDLNNNSWLTEYCSPRS